MRSFSKALCRALRELYKELLVKLLVKYIKFLAVSGRAFSKVLIVKKIKYKVQL